MLITPKRLKLRTSNLTGMFPGTVWTLPLKNFSKRGRGNGHVTPDFFGALNANSSKTVKVLDFKFETRYRQCFLVSTFILVIVLVSSTKIGEF